MIREIKTYVCICNKCKYEWTPKGNNSLLHIKNNVKMCARCKTTKWNIDDNSQEHSA
jgi:hypothetical protein